MGASCKKMENWNLLVLLGIVTLTLWLWPWTISALSVNVGMDIRLGDAVNGESSGPVLPFLNETETGESYRMDKSLEADGVKEEDEVVGVKRRRVFKHSSNSTKLRDEVFEQIPIPLELVSPPECYPVYSFDTVGPYRQEEVKTRATERIYYYRETDTNEEQDTILMKEEFGLICFTKFINCTVPPTASTATSRKTPNCVYFEKEFCTRKHTQLKWKGSVCPTIQINNQQDYKCKLRALGDSGGVEVAGSTNGKNKTLHCKNSDALCLALKPPFHTRSVSDRNPPTQTMCLCPLGYTGPTCSRMDIDLFHLDLLHNIDLRNILLKYQQKDRYFIGVTLLFLLIVTLSSVLLIVAGVAFLFDCLQKRKTLILEDSPERYASRAGSSRSSRGEGDGQGHHQGHPHPNQGLEIEEKQDDAGESRPGPRSLHPGGKRKSARLGVVMRQTAITAYRGLVEICRVCHIPCKRQREEEDEDYYDSDLELRFHRSRMERRARLSQRGRVSV